MNINYKNDRNNQVRYSDEYAEKMEILQKIYNISVKTKLFEHIIDLLLIQNGGFENLKNNIKK